MSHPKHVLHDAPGHLFDYAEAFQTIRRSSKLCADAAAFRQALGFPASAATWATVAPVVRGSLSSSTIVTWSDGLQAAKRLLAAVQATGQLVEQVIAMETARMRIARAAAWRVTTELEMATWRAEEQERMAQEDDEEAKAAAAGRSAHRRVVRLSPWAPRLLRTRPLVEAITWDGRPLLPVSTVRRDGKADHAVREQLRACKRTKFDGTTPQPLRAAALLSDERRREATDLRRKGSAAACEPTVVNAPAARTVVHPAGGLENGSPQHVFHEPMIRAAQQEDGRTLQPRDNGFNVQVVEVRSEPRAALDRGPPTMIVLYVREGSEEWPCSAVSAVGDAIDATMDRALNRTKGQDNTANRSDMSGGPYVNHGSTTLWQETRTEGLPEGSRSVQSLVHACSEAFRLGYERLTAMVRSSLVAADSVASETEETLSLYELVRQRTIAANNAVLRSLGLTPPDLLSSSVYRKRYGAPYRHLNGRLPEVQRVCEADAIVMGAAARVLKTHLPHVYDALWAPVRAAPVVAPIVIYPTPAQQQGRGRREWDVRDALPSEADAASMPLGHVASRTAGAGEGETTDAQCACVSLGVSNSHIDRVDSFREYGSPIVYASRIAPGLRGRLRPLPSSDLVLAENGCSASEGGGRIVRIVTCTPGWVCVVLGPFERCLHGGVYPVGPCGQVVDPTTRRPYLERMLVPGVELLRLVIYQMARVDDFCNAVQAEYDARADGSGVLCEAQRELLRDVYWSLDAPLDERFRMLHAWLPQKPDDECSAPFGRRGRWQHG